MRFLATLTALLLLAVAGHGPVAAAEAGPSPSASPQAEGSSLPGADSPTTPDLTSLPDVNPICLQAFTSGPEPTTEPITEPDADPDAGTETNDQLDAAIRACASLEEWLAAATLYPEALRGADAVALLMERCDDTDAGLDAYATCRSLVIALATPSPSPQPTPTPKPTPSPDPDRSPNGNQTTTLQPGADGLVRLPRKLTANVPGASRVRYFNIGGTSAAGLMRQTQKRARRHCGSHLALACVKLRWGIQTTQSSSSSSCTITDVDWRLTSTVHLPRWASPRRVDPALLTWWKKVLRQSARHEARHIKIQRTQLAKLRDRLLGKPCSAVDRQIRKTQRQSRKAQDAFDVKEYAKPLPPAP